MCLIRFIFNILTLVVLFHYSNGTVYDYFNKIYKKIFAGSCHEALKYSSEPRDNYLQIFLHYI